MVFLYNPNLQRQESQHGPRTLPRTRPGTSCRCVLGIAHHLPAPIPPGQYVAGDVGRLLPTKRRRLLREGVVAADDGGILGAVVLLHGPPQSYQDASGHGPGDV